MARLAGSRNNDFEASKRQLLIRLARRATAGSSFRQLASQAKVSPATLRHYFRDRETVLHEVLVLQRSQGGPYLIAAAHAEMGDVRESLRWLLTAIAGAWTRSLGPIHALGIGAGLGDPRLGPSYVNEILEPTLQSVEQRLQKHIDSGELFRTNVRHAALALLSPVLLGLLHQQGLFGSRCRPLDLGAFIDDHLEHFLKSYMASKR